MIKQAIKFILKRSFFRPNRVYRIFKGPMRGLKFKVTLNTEWSPIFGNWEPESQWIFTNLVHDDNIVFDIGANTGIHTLLFSKLVGKNGKVIAFEPVPDNINEVNNNLDLNEFENYQIEELAVSNKEGMTTFNLGLNNKRGSLIGRGHESGSDIKVQVTTLDKFCDAQNLYPDFIKMDIEGGEKEALEGYHKAVSQSYPIIYVESHTLENELAIENFLIKHDYIIYRLKKDSLSDLGIKHLQLVKKDEKLFPNNNRGDGTVVAIHQTKLGKI